MESGTIASGQSGRQFSRRLRDPSAARGMVDVVFIVDESRSMVAEHAWLKDMVSALESRLLEDRVGVLEPNRYALIGFANPDPKLEKGRIVALGGGADQPFGNPSEFSGGVDMLALRGDDEDGYSAMQVALNNLTFRPRAARQFILVSDEERDVLDAMLTYNETLRRLLGAGVKLNVVVKHLFAVLDEGTELFVLGLDRHMNAYTRDGRKLAGGFPFPESGYETTYKDYVRMAFATGGGAWDLNILRKSEEDVLEAFTKAFLLVKVEEIVEQLNGTCEECTCTDGLLACEVVPAARTRRQCETGVIVDLVVAIFPSQSNKRVGEPASFACAVMNDDLASTPILTWSPIPPNAYTVNDNLVFKSVTLENGGTYTCEARTSTGRYGTATATMRVTDGSEQPSTVLPTTIAPPVFTDTPTPSFGTQLQIMNFLCSAILHCFAGSQAMVVGITPSTSETVNEGDRIEFRCSAVGSPSPTIRWIDPSGRVQATSSPGGSGIDDDGDLIIFTLALQMTDITNADEGSYSCEARNDLGTDDLTLQLVVQGN